MTIFSLQLYCGYLLAVTTSWDTEAVFRGAINLIEQGHLANHTDYFHVFPHNLGVVSALQLLFTIFSAEKIQDFYLIATIYNALSITTGLGFVYLICREHQGVKTAFLALCLGTCCIPLYFYTPIFYSDTLSLPFVAISYYLYLQIQKSQTLKQKVLIAAIFALMCAAGTLIKFTVLIVAIAILIDLTLKAKLKKNLLVISIAAACIYILLSCFNYYRENYLLDKNLSEQKEVPHTHWVMMGLSGNGAYNGSDYGYTHSFPTIETRTQATIDRIHDRLHEYGFDGYMEFLHRKQQVNFGSGIYGVNEMIDDGPLRPNALHQVALDSGKYYEIFRHLAQGFHIFLFLLIALSALYDAATRTHSALSKLTLRLSITGIFIFLALWEANSRYILNFAPLFIACAALGFTELYRVASVIKNALSEHIQESRETAAT